MQVDEGRAACGYDTSVFRNVMRCDGMLLELVPVPLIGQQVSLPLAEVGWKPSLCIDDILSVALMDSTKVLNVFETSYAVFCRALHSANT